MTVDLRQVQYTYLFMCACDLIMRSSCATYMSHSMFDLALFLLCLINYIQAMLQLWVLSVQDMERSAGRLIFRSIVFLLMRQILRSINTMVGPIVQ